MSKIIFAFLVSILNITIICAQTATAPPAGDGSVGSPYIISNLENLYWLSQNSGEWSKHYIQTSEIDASASSGWDGGAGWTPIGNSGIKFTGSYEGMGYSIDELYINRPSSDYQGLFGYTDGAEITDIGITNAHITGQNYVGALIAYNNNSTVTYSYSSGSVTGTSSSWSYAGGLVGYGATATISNSYSTCTVTGGWRFGGMIGQLIGTSVVEYCYSTGRIIGAGGGFLGYRVPTTTTLTNCFWDVEKSSKLPLSPPSTSFGGGTGKTTAEMMQQSTYTGWNFSQVWNIYGSGQSYPYLRGMFAPPSQLQAFNNAGIINLFWGAPSTAPTGYNVYRDGEKINTSLVTGLSYNDAAAVSGSRYCYYVTAVYPSNISQPSNITPYLDLRFPFGTGVANDPYLISTHSHLNYVRDHLTNSGIHFKVVNNIDLTSECLNGGAYYDSGKGWTPIGKTTTDNHFCGNFDGNNYVISGLTINRPSEDAIGLFGCTDGATIENLGVTNASITGASEVAGLVGRSKNSTINNSYATGTIIGTSWAIGGLTGYGLGSIYDNCYAAGTLNCGAGTWDVGGFIGYSENENISDSYSSVTVTAEGDVGGFVGYSDGSSFSNSYATQNVTGTYTGAFNSYTYVGGFVGYSYDDTFSNCYATGEVNCAGGVAGGFSGESYQDNLTNCYATGNVTDTAPRETSYAGGFAGRCYNSTLSYTSASGNVSGHYHIGGLVAVNKETAIEFSSASGNVTSTADEVGGLVGLNDNSTIQNCSASGNVVADGTSYIGQSGGPESYDVGGLVGYNKSGNIIDSYASGDVSGYSNVGGLVGTNHKAYISPVTIDAVITNSYSVGKVTGAEFAGGLTGTNSGTINDSFWDTETSTQAASTGGTGKTTAEMKTQSTFTDAGWDFNTVWNIYGGQVYPFLQWEDVIPPENNAPVVDKNTGVTLDQGGSVVITNSMLHCSDPDGTSYLSYYLIEVPVNGQLQNEGVALNVGSTFQQTDIAAGNLIYIHDGNETNSDSFQFEVSDNRNATAPPETFEITINPSAGFLMPPSNVVFSYDENGNIVITWRDNTGNELGFRVRRQRNTTAKANIINEYELIAELPADAEKFTDEDINEGASYSYRITSFNNEGESDAAAGDDGGEPTVTAPLSTPTNLAASDNGIGAIVLVWEDNSSLETGYKIERTTSDTWEEIYSSGANVITYTDSNVEESITYHYRVKAINSEIESVYSNECEASCTLTGLADWERGIPTEFTLHQNYPNPFNPSTIIRFGLPSESHVSIKIFNLLGQEMRTIVNNVISAGYHEIKFDASQLTSGVYIYRIQSGDFVEHKKMVLTK